MQKEIEVLYQVKRFLEWRRLPPFNVREIERKPGQRYREIEIHERERDTERDTDTERDREKERDSL